MLALFFKTRGPVYLSPSTQEHNIGYGNYGTEEERMNQVADVTEKILKAHGITVYRNKPEMTLAQVVADSNAKKPNIHFAIHSNASGNRKSRGAEVFCHRFGGEGEKLARSIYSELTPLTPTGDRGVMEGYNFYGPGKPIYELAKTKAPAALVEVAFHDNKEDATWITQSIESIGIALAKGVLNYFHIPYTASAKTKEEPLTDETLYRVMAGSYAIRRNAEYQVQRLKNAGFDATIMVFKK